MNSWAIVLYSIIIISLCWELLVDFLNLKKVNKELPAQFKGIYSEEKYAQSQDYLVTNTKFGMLESIFSTSVLLIALYSGLFASIDSFVRTQWQSEIFRSWAFIGILLFASSILGLGFSYYKTFVIEEKFGFNKSTRFLFFKDLLVSFLVGAVIGAPILAGIVWFFQTYGANAWWVSWLFLAVIQIFLMFVAPIVIMPLFNKFSPLADGDLKNQIENFSKKHQFQLDGIFTMDGSKRSSKANAFFTGFGRFRRIVFFDTILEKQSVNELLAILAHEMGHFKLKHIYKQSVLSLVSSLFMFFMLGLVMNNLDLHQAIGLQETSIYTSLVLFGFLYSPVSQLVSLYSLYLSRKYEFEADAFAVKAHGNAKDLISALKKLSVENLSNLYPHPWKVFFQYTHPPILKRLDVLEKI